MSVIWIDYISDHILTRLV